MLEKGQKNVSLRPALVQEAKSLTELCLRSKAVWGYDAAFLDACRNELEISPDDILSSLVYVAENDGSVVGVARVTFHGETAELEKLFVDPAFRNLGAGHVLFAWAVVTARAHGALTMHIESDPGAAEFYRRMGAQDAGKVASGSIPGRFIPCLKVDLRKEMTQTACLRARS
ncbi:GNAT family N-acetyltransferase [Gluconacetobacter azotocaptans]|uniref:GNAT family N-acetyltransferase n=1 Tax=Gluconacetobacter azotocaptans TaxID=142834 RepID=A0A7W4JPZ1_9PROT|nr:GNAT family N-acetyltransferase [Gluconacetobacter azotocaptans]MBB2188777.1 GNAT family N-acetyltransferase [Gluconacetobacter azotocaptans]GBQ28807.1 acetyltransferase [Gluconacetobacter azotocaptans DSM 13594]